MYVCMYPGQPLAAAAAPRGAGETTKPKEPGASVEPGKEVCIFWDLRDMCICIYMRIYVYTGRRMYVYVHIHVHKHVYIHL